MKNTSMLLAFVLNATLAISQSLTPEYSLLIKKADSLYQNKDYEKSALAFSEAFKTIGWKGLSNDRYNAACSWALSNNPDSAFFNLNRIATKSNYTDLEHITSDPDLIALHSDIRWELLIDLIKQNKEKSEINLNKPLAAQLDSIYNDDQKYRKEISEIENKYGWDSKEIQNHWKIIQEKDSINLIKVSSILDRYGWLGADVVGEQGNSALFLVIQHSEIATQEKYLPMMRDAVKNGRANGSSLALLEDRVALRQGKKQIYGSQIARDPENQTHYILPLDDPDNVDKRRAEVGLEPLANYVIRWQIKWDAEQYKKELPAIEAKEKIRQK